MDTVREHATAQVITMMTPAEKARLESKARRARLSPDEFVRRSVDAYEPEESLRLDQLAELARAFRESAERASAAVDRAREDVSETRRQLRRNQAGRAP